MMTTQREELRRTYLTAWQKHTAQQPLTALEAQIVAVLQQHPEYQTLLENPTTSLLTQSYTTDNNPFLHLSLHITLREQIALNRPHGIKPIYQQLLQKNTDSHHTEHRMMEIIAQLLWDAQQNNVFASETDYLQQLKML